MFTSAQKNLTVTKNLLSNAYTCLRIGMLLLLVAVMVMGKSASAQSDPSKIIPGSAASRHAASFQQRRQTEETESRLQTSPSISERSTTATGEIYGLFVGMADYPKHRALSDLPYCDADAERMHKIFTDQYGMQPENGILLTNRHATLKNIRESFDKIGQEIGEEDTLVFFFSGHGGRDEGRQGRSGKSGGDEVICLADQELSDEQLAEWLHQSGGGTSLVILDSCLSGGFAPEIAALPGGIGFFSSTGNQPSDLPDSRTEAGGFLSIFFAEAINSCRTSVDRNRDHNLSIREIARYLEKRYREGIALRGAHGIDHNRPTHDLVVEYETVHPESTILGSALPEREADQPAPVQNRHRRGPKS